MNVLFYGTPELAVPFLEEVRLAEQVVAVVTQPDRRAGRGLCLLPTPVKAAALKRGLAVHQPQDPSQIAGDLKRLSPDLAVVVAYGKILKPDLLSVPRLGTLNVHFSLLPRHRGASPIAWSLWQGDAKTGVTLFWLDEGMDTGPIFLKEEIPIGPDEDAVGLTGRLVGLGVNVLRKGLKEARAGRLVRAPQSGEPSYARKLAKEDGRIDFSRSAAEVHNQVRAMRDWPVAFTTIRKNGREMRIGILKTSLPESRIPSLASPRTILRIEEKKGFLVQCGAGSLWIVQVQPEGGKSMPSKDFLNGFRWKEGDVI